MRILLIVRFDGTDYCGFQSQANARSVQDAIQSAINMVTGEGNRVVASGRTDEGVHAYAMPMHFDTQRDYPPHKFKSAINNFLPDDIRVIEAERVSDDFHARYYSVSKTYLYKLYLSRDTDPLKSRYYARANPELDLDRMLEGANYLIGEHDFSSFMKRGSNPRSTIRTIHSIDIEQTGDEVFIYVNGNGFLYNMVRIIVALLLKVGEGIEPPEIVKDALSSGSREFTRSVAPASGLYLYNVDYPIQPMELEYFPTQPPDDIVPAPRGKALSDEFYQTMRETMAQDHSKRTTRPAPLRTQEEAINLETLPGTRPQSEYLDVMPDTRARRRPRTSERVRGEQSRERVRGEDGRGSRPARASRPVDEATTTSKHGGKVKINAVGKIYKPEDDEVSQSNEHILPDFASDPNTYASSDSLPPEEFTYSNDDHWSYPLGKTNKRK